MENVEAGKGKDGKNRVCVDAGEGEISGDKGRKSSVLTSERKRRTDFGEREKDL